MNFWITGTARSGTTVLAQILATAHKVEVTVEKPPVLHRECRQLYDGNLENPSKVFYDAKLPTMVQWNLRGIVYGDKNVNYVPFIPIIKEKVLFLIRDGRKVVRSLMNWNTHFRNIYVDSEGEEPGLADYCRPRPRPDDPYHKKWRSLNKFEMVCWYWQEWNRLALDLLNQKKKGSYVVINMDLFDATAAHQLFMWLELEGFNENKVKQLLGSRINSLKERFGEEDTFPTYVGWTKKQKKTFWRICGGMFERVERLWQIKYNEATAALNQTYGDSPWFNVFMTESNFRIYLWILRHVNCDAAVLDAGGGWGALPVLLSKHGYVDCTLNDVLSKRILNGWRLAKAFRTEIKYRRGNMLNLNGEKKYDVVASATWQHPNYPYEQVIKRFASLLRPHGYVILTFWNEEGNIEEARQQFLKHYSNRRNLGTPFPSVSPSTLENLFKKHGLHVVDWNLTNTPPTPNMTKMECSTPEHLVVAQK